MASLYIPVPQHPPRYIIMLCTLYLHNQHSSEAIAANTTAISMTLLILFSSSTILATIPTQPYEPTVREVLIEMDGVNTLDPTTGTGVPEVEQKVRERT